MLQCLNLHMIKEASEFLPGSSGDIYFSPLKQTQQFSLILFQHIIHFPQP